MSRITEEKFRGVLLVEGTSYEDERGKLFKPLWNSVIPNFRADEAYYIISKKNVLRGMHYQTAPHEQGKFVYVTKGSVLDVVVDLRKDSPSYGNYASFLLRANDMRGLYVPPGVAHGYLTLEEDSVIHYVQTGNYSREHERGIRYDSFGMDWKCERPILSDKDMRLPSLSEL
jgi:dTDP-4-dehydrorhamnose 3,5-epimerase/CDP-3, 6-dideoxy-D-glycero-D-glycero-4-hexulose-5-epimerase